MSCHNSKPIYATIFSNRRKPVKHPLEEERTKPN
uniref:Uncharacterized protein n=1 Tax=Rhizophora mucronata TaxID=61149 RepID=A0A2P2QUM0_RHIMU